MIKKCLIAFSGLLFLAACATFGTETVSGKKEPWYSREPLHDAIVVNYVNQIAQRLAEKESANKIGFPKIGVHVLKTSRIQGTSRFDGPEIEITRGMLNVLMNEAELACLVGHEIGHKVLHRNNLHYKKGRSWSDILLPDDMAEAKWSQKREEEADEYGAILCHSAGYNPHAFLAFMDRMSRFQKNDFFSALNELTATHKDFRNRAKKLKGSLERENIPIGEGLLKRAEYMDALASLQQMRSGDVVNELLSGGTDKILQKLKPIEEELKKHFLNGQPLGSDRFIEIMDEASGIVRQYEIFDATFHRDTVPMFMKEVLSQDSPLWNTNEIRQKIKEILILAGRVGVGFIPALGDAIDLYEFLTGREFGTEYRLSLNERVITVAGLLAGSGKMWREVIQGINQTLTEATLVNRIGRRTAADGAYALKQAESIGEATKDWVYHTPINPGPLPKKVVQTFRSETYIAYRNVNPIILYRVQGGLIKSTDKPGVFWTRTKPSGAIQSMIDSALDPNWGNKATHWIEIEVPAGQRFYEGSAATQRGLVGGGNQIYLGNAQYAWIKKQGQF